MPTAATAPDLTSAPLPAGDTPLDVYYRLMTGVDGSPMASFAQALEGQDVWALVDHVLVVASEGPTRAARRPRRWTADAHEPMVPRLPRGDDSALSHVMRAAPAVQCRPAAARA